MCRKELRQFSHHFFSVTCLKKYIVIAVAVKGLNRSPRAHLLVRRSWQLWQMRTDFLCDMRAETNSQWVRPKTWSSLFLADRFSSVQKCLVLGLLSAEGWSVTFLADPAIQTLINYEEKGYLRSCIDPTSFWSKNTSKLLGVIRLRFRTHPTACRSGAGKKTLSKITTFWLAPPRSNYKHTHRHTV